MKLEDTARQDGWTLIILDPVSRLMGAEDLRVEPESF